MWRQWSANPVPLTNVRAEEVNASPNYNSVNRNKRSLCLDLKSPAGRDLFLRLVAHSDVVMENYTPDVMARFRLDHATLAAVNPRVVMTSFSGYGKSGPLRDFKANGTLTVGIAGVTISICMILTFLLVCMGIIAWIFKTGYRLRN